MQAIVVCNTSPLLVDVLKTHADGDAISPVMEVAGPSLQWVSELAGNYMGIP